MSNVFLAEYVWTDDEHNTLGVFSTFDKANEALQEKMKELIHDFDGTAYIPYGTSFIITNYTVDDPNKSETPVYIDFSEEEDKIKQNNLVYWRSRKHYNE